MELYLDAAEHSWAAVTLPDESGQLSNPNFPSNRATAEIYNTSLRGVAATREGQWRLQTGTSDQDACQWSATDVYDPPSF